MKITRLFTIGGVTIVLLVLGSVAAFAQEGQGDPPNPVTSFLAGITGASHDEITSQQNAGHSLGNIGRAYLFAELGGGSATDALSQSQGKGWGVMFKKAGLNPGGGGRGLGRMIGKGHTQSQGKPDHAGGPPEWAGGPPDHANAGGKGKDQRNSGDNDNADNNDDD